MTGKVLTIVDLMLGRFARFFPVATWRAWIAVAAAIFGLGYGLSPEDQTLVLGLMGRTVLPGEAAREAFLVIGRRGGKSRFASWLAVYVACFRDYRGVLAAGEKGIVMILCPDRRQARTIFRYVEGLLDSDPMLAAMIVTRTKDSIELNNGIAIEIHTSTFRAVRGYTIVCAVVDEAAFLPDDDSAAPDSELLAALRPAMATVPGALLLVLSSPYARRGELWKAHKDHFGKDGDPVIVVQADTRTMNPSVPEDVIARAYADDSASASAEYGAQFRRDIEAFVSREAIEACTLPGCLELPPSTGTYYTAFVDPSGGAADSFSLAIGHRDKDGRAVLDCAREVVPPFSPESTVTDFAALLKTYRVLRVTGDRYAGEWPREQFRKHGISYDISERSKSEIYQAALPLLNSKRADLLDLPRLARQLQQLERRVSRGGRDSIDHGPNQHDDLANACCGALVLVGLRAAQPMQIVSLGSGAPISGTFGDVEYRHGAIVSAAPYVSPDPPAPAVGIPTRRVKLADGRTVIVNEADFDPTIHQPWRDDAPSPTAQAVPLVR